MNYHDFSEGLRHAYLILSVSVFHGATSKTIENKAQIMSSCTICTKASLENLVQNLSKTESKHNKKGL